jgi:nucleotide-binding universal stress UspA family protein
MTDKIVLIASSLGEESDALVRTGLAWARAEGARVSLVHAFAPPLATSPVIGGFGRLAFPLETDALLADEEAQMRGLLEEQVRRAGISPDETAGHVVRNGPPHRVLGDLAAELGAGLIVVGATAGGALHRLLGSTADRVLRRAACPVLVVRGELGMPPARVLAPVDLSPLSAEAFRTGLERLGGLPGKSSGDGPEIEALFVLSPIQRQVSPQFTPEQVDRFAEDELEQFVTAHAGDARGRVRRQVRVGTVREEILAEIEARRPDLVLLGTHGLGGFDRLVIGSVAADVVREAPCSVLVIPSDRPPAE